MLRRGGGREALELRLRLGARRVGTEASEHLERPVAAGLVRPRAVRHPDRRLRGEHHAFGHDADDRGGLPVHAQDAPEHAAIRAVPVLPDAVADDDDALGAPRVLAGREVTAEERLLSEHLERVGREIRAARLLGEPAIVREVHAGVRESRDPGERPALRAPFLELDERERVRAAVRRPLRTEHVELRRVLERQALDEDRVHEREHGGVHADPEREGRHRDRGEPSLLGDEAEREAKIVEQAHTDLHTYEPVVRLTEKSILDRSSHLWDEWHWPTIDASGMNVERSNDVC